jgi:hypothetical protein
MIRSWPRGTSFKGHSGNIRGTFRELIAHSGNIQCMFREHHTLREHSRSIIAHSRNIQCTWPRGTGFPRTLPNAVTSIVYHPLGSPSLLISCWGLCDVLVVRILDLGVSKLYLHAYGREGNIQETFREHSGNIRGAFREHSENNQNNMLGTKHKFQQTLSSNAPRIFPECSLNVPFTAVGMQAQLRHSQSEEKSG